MLTGKQFKRHRAFLTIVQACALGSVYSSDPRVWSEGVDIPLSRGWKWHDQVVAHSTFQDTLSLHELQTYCVRVNAPSHISSNFIIAISFIPQRL